MVRPYDDDGYVEDSEGEENTPGLKLPVARNPTGLPFPPPLPLVEDLQDETISTIQTFSTGISSNHPHSPNLSIVQASSFMTSPSAIDPSFVSDISTFGPNSRIPVSSIQTSHTTTTIIDNLASTSVSTSAPSAPRTKPRPRPAYKRKDPIEGDSSISTGAPSNAVPVTARPSSSSRTIPPTAATVLATPRTSDSGIELVDSDMMDIAERAKLRSRARSQATRKQVIPIEDDVIELTSSDDEDELSFLPTAKAKAKPKTRKSVTSKQPASEAAKGKGKVKGKDKGKTRDVSKPSPRKRSKISRAPESGFESDVNTIPVPTSDFPVPLDLSSQLPPSDPPPPPSTAGSSAPSLPHMSQELGAPGPRDESPLSSPPPLLPRKRKRLRAPSGVNSDLDAEDSILMGATGAEPLRPYKGHIKEKPDQQPAPLLPPLPDAFPQVVPETQPPAKVKALPRRKRRSMDDDEEWANDLREKPSAFTPKNRKKARVNDDGDDDWAGEGAAKGTTKKKPAKKAAPKAKVTRERLAKSRAEAKEVMERSHGEHVVGSSKNAHADKNTEAMPPPPIPFKETERTRSPHGDAPDATESISAASFSTKGKGKQRAVVLSDDEDDAGIVGDVSTNTVGVADTPVPPAQKKGGRKIAGGDQGAKENDAPAPPPRPAASTSPGTSSIATGAKPATLSTPIRSSFAQANRAYTIASKQNKSTPMSELIRRVSSLPGSPFPTMSRPAYSPLAKASKSVLRRIAPLHPNRRTPPPPPPKAPPPKKSKKMLDLEEKWEMELEDTVEGWYTMSEAERGTLKRQKRDHEMGYED